MADTSLGRESLWTIFQTAPARLVHPRHIVQAYDGAISVGAAVKLQQCDRVQRALARLLRDKFQLPEPSSCPRPAEEDLKLLALLPEQIEQHIRVAGAVFWSHVLAGEIRSREVAEMKSQIGEMAFQIALDNRDLAAGHLAPAGIDQLMQAIETDGRRCWASWQAALPEPLAAWMRLRYEADEDITLSQASEQRHAVIVRRLVQDKAIEPMAKEAR
ncbi:type III secretion protein (plasmid) [Ensifer adhaerens]|uniref:type III secretion protein n=1 Tax=Ensifer adhaerens TaxID=106592 RepID=UPI0021016E77|nr:type III secretion protein [Ensifer adhaerens]UTV41883.1 type III secretion protein [Ensifer adhaerens]